MPSPTPFADAGDIRTSLGHELDGRLPLPEHRRRFRRWRRTRPFWAGALVIAGGSVILSHPLGPLFVMVQLGAAALTTVAIGLILITGGLFIWFAPEQRHFVAIVLMICSVLSLVTSNLGGFLLGMILGMAGSSMAFGWRPGAPRPRSSPSPSPRRAPPPGDHRKAAVAVVGLVLAATSVAGGSTGQAHALGFARQAGERPIPPAGCGQTRVVADTLTAQNVVIRGTRMLRTACGEVEVVDLYIPAAQLTNYQLLGPGKVARMGVDTDLEIFDTVLLTPRMDLDVDLAALVASALGLPSVPGLPTAPVPLTPEFVNTLDSLGLLGENGLTIPALSAAPARWLQPYIHGEVHLIRARMSALPGTASESAR